MCVDNSQIARDEMEHSKKSKSASYSIKKVLKTLFRKQSRTVSSNLKSSLNSLESLDNMRNSQVEGHYEEIEENTANEKLLSCIYDEVNRHPEAFEWDTNPSTGEDEVFVPVRFARTNAGTFFWTTNLQPVDVDLVQPAYCYSTCQHPELQFQDRWAQA